jgi:ATP-binding cassette subfamily B (MDR/TAP) protein 6
VDGRSTSSDFVIFITYLAQLYGPLSLLGTIYRSLNSSLVDTEKLLKLLNEPKDVNDKPNAPDLIIQDGELEFDNVSFSYDDKTTALQNVSFKIKKGSSLALVGESGSGKSTILRLLYRFYDLKEGQGRILIDGQDIRDVTQSSLRKAIGVVPQDSVLFNSSIRYNIGYGKLGSTPEEIENAARAASLHERIMSFPKGYQTIVGERGVRLSGGEKQRVAIARTLLKNPPILLLDEATSALDTSTEKDIQKAFETLVEGRSSLSIAHRLSTIAAADLILVLKDGHVVEAGNHAELIAREGVFASMWADQISASDHVSTKRQSVSGYEIADSETAAEQDVKLDSPAVQDMPADIVVEAEAADDAPGPIVDEPESITFPSSDNGKPASIAPSANGHVPSLPPKDNAPISFPGVSFPGGGYDDESQRAASTDTPRAAQTPGVTFEAQAPPSESRGDTPDPEAEPKRKRISSQNFQRLARRISITTRRSGSIGAGISIPNIPGFKRDNSGKSKDDAPVTDAPVVTDSPAGSVRGPSEDSTPPARATLKKKEKRKSTI